MWKDRLRSGNDGAGFKLDWAAEGIIRKLGGTGSAIAEGQTDRLGGNLKSETPAPTPQKFTARKKYSSSGAEKAKIG